MNGPTNQIVQLGETANFTCTANGTGTLTFMLNHVTKGIVDVKEEIGSTEQITSSILPVMNVTIESSGIYWCSVTGEGKNASTHTGILTVQGELPAWLAFVHQE